MKNKKPLVEMLKNRFKKELGNKDFKLTTFRNFKEFVKIQLEYVNPTHIIDVWGLPQKQYRKTKYANYIRIGRIIITGLIPFVNLNFVCTDTLIYNLIILLYSYIYTRLVFYVLDNKPESDKNTYWNRRGTWWGKNITTRKIPIKGT